MLRHVFVRSYLARHSTMLLPALLLITSAACAPTQFHTDARFDPDYDFDSKSTYAFEVAREKTKKSPSAPYVEAALRDWLTKRGYTETTADRADLLINYDVGVYVTGELGGSRSTTRREGSITIWVDDPKTGENVWYGWSERIITPQDEPEPTIRAAIDAIFENQIPAAKRSRE